MPALVSLINGDVWVVEPSCLLFDKNSLHTQPEQSSIPGRASQRMQPRAQRPLHAAVISSLSS